MIKTGTTPIPAEMNAAYFWGYLASNGETPRRCWKPFDFRSNGGSDSAHKMHSNSLLTNPYFIAIISPTALLVLGTLGKGIIRGGISQQIFYLGFDASLSALYAGMVYLYDVARDPGLRNEGKLELIAGFIIVAFVLFFGVVICHQIWEKDEKKDRKVAQFLVLGILATLLVLAFCRHSYSL
jgi:hypothetical protein